MTIKNLIRRHHKETTPDRRIRGSDLVSLQRDMNSLFDDFFGGFAVTPWQLGEDRLIAFSPSVDVAETEREVKITAELPGMDEKNVEVMLDENAVTLKGEKKEEHEDSTASSYHMERSYGSFHRVIPLPVAIRADEAKATFKKGVLTVVLPKAEAEKAKGKKVEIKVE